MPSHQLILNESKLGFFVLWFSFYFSLYIHCTSIYITYSFIQIFIIYSTYTPLHPLSAFNCSYSSSCPLDGFTYTLVSYTHTIHRFVFYKSNEIQKSQIIFIFLRLAQLSFLFNLILVFYLFILHPTHCLSPSPLPPVLSVCPFILLSVYLYLSLSLPFDQDVVLRYFFSIMCATMLPSIMIIYKALKL